MNKSEQINEIADALAKAQAKMSNASFNKINPHYKSKYADLAAIRDAAIPALSENDISIVQSTDIEEGNKVIVVTTLMHKSGQFISGKFPVLAQQGSPQAMGSAMTYARRYAFASMVGIASEEDDDGNQAENGYKQVQKPQPAQAKQIPLNEMDGTITYYNSPEEFIAAFTPHSELLSFQKNKDILIWFLKNNPDLADKIKTILGTEACPA